VTLGNTDRLAQSDAMLAGDEVEEISANPILVIEPKTPLKAQNKRPPVTPS
jgi:hypothetical protein